MSTGLPGIRSDIESKLEKKIDIESKKTIKTLHEISKSIIQDEEIKKYLIDNLEANSGIVLGVSKYKEIFIPYGITLNNKKEKILTFNFEQQDGFYVRPIPEESDKKYSQIMDSPQNSESHIQYYKEGFPLIYNEQKLPTPKRYIVSIQKFLNKPDPPIAYFKSLWPKKEILRRLKN